MRLQRLVSALFAIGLGLVTTTIAEGQRRTPPPPRNLTDATVVRQQADRITRHLRQNFRTSSEARSYVRRSFPSHARTLARALQRTASSATPSDELRAAAALARSLHAASRIDARGTRRLRNVSNHVDRQLGQARYRARVGQHESAVELETYSSSAIIDAFTTPDGTVGPVLTDGGQPAPEFLTALAGTRPVASVRWDELSNDQKIDLLRSQSVGRQFFSNRRMPGIVFRRQIRNTLQRPVTLAGQTQTGDAVNVDGVLLPIVEYMGPDSVNTLDGVEAHVRENGPASRTLDDARTLQALLDIVDPAVHQHITTTVNPALRRGDALERVRLVDFYRRANLVAELQAVLEGGALQTVRDGMVTYFDFLSASNLAVMNGHLRSLAVGAQAQTPLYGHSQLKMAAVGFRPGALYDDPNVFGFEVRTLGQEASAERNNQLVDAIQRGLIGGSYGRVPWSVIGSWHRSLARRVRVPGSARRRPLAVVSPEDEDRALVALHYNGAPEEMLQRAPSYLRITDAARTRFSQEAATHLGLKMLVHDWGRDPVLQDRGDDLGRIRQAQQTGLDQLASGERPGQIVYDFVRASGLYSIYAESLGMDVP